MMRRGPLAALLLVAWLMPSADSPAFQRTEGREPCASYSALRMPLFGDTHVHTSFSFDAWGQGTRSSPRDAYRFARGEPLGIQPFDKSGRPLRQVQLRRPLDFAVVTDHAELLGETHICQTPGAPGHDSFICTLVTRWPKLGYMIINSQTYDIADPVRYDFCGDNGRVCIEAAARPNAWSECPCSIFKTMMNLPRIPPASEWRRAAMLNFRPRSEPSYPLSFLSAAGGESAPP